MGKPLGDEALDTLFRTARTANGYNGDPVTEADIRAIYELVKRGPTSANQQAGRFVWLLSQDGKDKLAALSAREREIASLIVDGATNKEVAAKLRISERTVKGHLSNVFQKLRVTDRLKLMLLVRGP